jgi:glutamyl-Q tRNA(Asp) synthetase
VAATDARRTGRFAPSPTGPLHFGSLVAALASACDARARGARWLVRIEDVDIPRSVPGAADDILHTLSRYDFAWDGPVEHQSDRTAHYAAALRRLVDAGHAYPCACTRRELEGAPLGPGGERIYPGTCREGVPPALASRPQRAFRVRVGDAEVSFVDRLQGPQRQRLPDEVGDFVVMRADGLYAYQLAVVVDDAAQHVTDVVRGADLLDNTPRQIHLQRALGLPALRYLHVPVVVNERGEKLSKQTSAAPLDRHAPLAALEAAGRHLGLPRIGADDVASFLRAATAQWRQRHPPPH